MPERLYPNRDSCTSLVTLRGPGLLTAEGDTPKLKLPSKSHISNGGFLSLGVVAQGQGHATTLAQIAAAELGASFEDVTVVAGDTALVPFGMGTGGSRVTANAGPAVARTAQGRVEAGR